MGSLASHIISFGHGLIQFPQHRNCCPTNTKTKLIPDLKNISIYKEINQIIVYFIFCYSFRHIISLRYKSFQIKSVCIIICNCTLDCIYHHHTKWVHGWKCTTLLFWVLLSNAFYYIGASTLTKKLKLKLEL